MTVMTTERPATMAQPQSSGALAIRADQSMWTPEQAAVLRQSGIGESVTNAELAGFLHLCQRTGLDPFSRQIYLIGRWDRRAGREVFTPQTGIDGYRVVARRATAKTGGTYGYEDTLWCDSSGRWQDVWLLDEPPAAAKVTVIRDGQRFSAVARYSEYVQTGKEDKPIGMWRKMPASQLAKCCEALALRRAFPHDLAGVYTAEEMAQADNPQPAPQLQRQAPGRDAWATAQPAPDAQPQAAAEPWDAAAEGDISGGRDWINEATEAADVYAVRAVWRDAKAAGVPGTVLARLEEIGKGKPTPAEGAPPAPGAAPEGTLPGSPPAPSDRLGALAALYAAGEAAGLTPDETRRVLAEHTGRALPDTTPGEIAACTADLRAAGGAR